MAKKRPVLGAVAHRNGVTFSVWSPFAEQVFVTGSFNNWAKLPMVKDEENIWTVDAEGAEAGSEYKYVLIKDGTEYYKNDPRSLQLITTGGNGVITDTDFDWEGDRFRLANMNEQIIYEMHIGTFNRPSPSTIGTFYDAMGKLDYLADLGVNVIELMPVNPMNGDRGWGYAPNYIYAVESLYGGRNAMQEFVKAAHKKGIGVILDVVYNHLGPDGLDTWRFDGWGENDKGGIYFYNDWRSTTPWGETRLDYGRPEVQDFILDNVAMWIADFHLDGLRVDSTIYMRNVNGRNDDPASDIPEAWLLMQRLNKLVRKIDNHALTIAEDIGHNPYITEAIELGGAGFSSQWEVTLPHAIRTVLEPVRDSDRNLDELQEQLNKKFNADVFKRVVYSDSHDSAGNEGGARLSEQISPGKSTSVFARKRNLLASIIVMTSPGIPMIFQGHEFNQGGSFNDWQELDWEQVDKFEGVVQAHKHLIALRRNKYGNTRGLMGQSVAVTHRDDANKVLAWHRWMEGGPKDDVIIIANFSNAELKGYELPFPRAGKWEVRFNSSWNGYGPDFKQIAHEYTDATERGLVDLAPYSAIILSQD